VEIESNARERGLDRLYSAAKLILGRAKPQRQLAPAPLIWICLGAISIPIFILAPNHEWLMTPSGTLTLPMNVWLDIGMGWFLEHFKWLFRALAWLLTGPMIGLQYFLHWLPWPVTIVLIGVFSHFLGGWKLALFTSLALLYMVIIGYWDESMNTVSLVGVALPLSLLLGLFLGILGYRFQLARRIIEPALDIMQTIPAFAYLIPLILLFGFGPVVALVASAIYATPPMVRNVMLGLGRVPSELVESGRMSGCNERQLLWWVQFPSALPTIMIGVNQTIMAALAMVIIAAIIGGFQDIGWEVLVTMRKAEFGESLLSGAVIVLLAMIFDRMSRTAIKHSAPPIRGVRAYRYRHLHLWMALAMVSVLIVVAQIVPHLQQYPDTWTFYPAEPLNDAVNWFTATFFPVTDAIKKSVTFLLLLPMRIGLVNSVTPYFYGFSMSLEVKVGYLLLVALLAVIAGCYRSWRTAAAVILGGVLFYFGTTGIPWPIFLLVITVIAFQVGRWRIGLLALGGLCFIILGGLWERAMISVYLCGAAVLISFLFGALLGVWAAHNDRVSAFLRPINDTLQTIPPFVYLVPLIMVFLVGEFTALLAIIAYSIVPAIRYTEHGIRNVPHEVVEAATAMGCTKRQLLFYVKLPLALPEVTLGLNQTVMFGLAMLVITALVGTVGLGNLIYVALTKAQFGSGAIAGLGIALIAMITDRILQSWSQKKKQEFGLA
jgi:glycine betaine/proline transport system permease protein